MDEADGTCPPSRRHRLAGCRTVEVDSPIQPKNAPTREHFMMTAPTRPTPKSPGRPPWRQALLIGLAVSLAGCDRQATIESASGEQASATPTNRIEIPQPVRRNLGIEFARVEARPIESTLRVPGRFELLPDARHHHHAPLEGRVEVLVSELDPVAPGTPLYRLSGSGWRDLEDRIGEADGRLKSMSMLREALRQQQEMLGDRISRWEQRVEEEDRLRADGDRDGEDVTEAEFALDQARAHLSEVLLEEAGITAEESLLEIELDALRERRDRIQGLSACAGEDPRGLVICSTVQGIVEGVETSSGTHLDEGAPILSLIRPERLRVRARLLQSDLPLVSDGLSARISAPNAASDQALPWMAATVRLSPVADPTARTIDLLAIPEHLESWGRPGIGVSLEVILAGGGLELAIPERAVVEDRGTPVLFRRDPRDADRAIRIDADLGRSDGRWVEILSGVAEGDEIVVAGQDQLLLATSGERPTTGHFHADGTFHAEDH